MVSCVEFTTVPGTRHANLLMCILERKIPLKQYEQLLVESRKYRKQKNTMTRYNYSVKHVDVPTCDYVPMWQCLIHDPSSKDHKPPRSIDFQSFEVQTVLRIPRSCCTNCTSTTAFIIHVLRFAVLKTGMTYSYLPVLLVSTIVSYLVVEHKFHDFMYNKHNVAGSCTSTQQVRRTWVARYVYLVPTNESSGAVPLLWSSSLW